MVTSFDIFIVLAIVFIGLFSSHPKKAAMAIVLLIAGFGMVVNLFDDAIGRHAVYPLCAIIELVGAAILHGYGLQVVGAKDRYFFKVMACFLLVSAFLNLLVMPGIEYGYMPHSSYLLAFKSLAVLNVAVMAWYSDGISRFIRDIWGYFSSSNRASDGTGRG